MGGRGEGNVGSLLHGSRKSHGFPLNLLIPLLPSLLTPWYPYVALTGMGVVQSIDFYFFLLMFDGTDSLLFAPFLVYWPEKTGFTWAG